MSGEQRGVLAAVDDLQTASRQGDAKKICTEIFTAALARSIRHASGHSCPAEVKDRYVAPDASIAVARQIDVKGSRATATIREQTGKASTLFLVRSAPALAASLPAGGGCPCVQDPVEGGEGTPAGAPTESEPV